MAAYIARRTLFIALVLVAVSMLVFAITTLLPANVATSIAAACTRLWPCPGGR